MLWYRRVCFLCNTSTAAHRPLLNENRNSGNHLSKCASIAPARFVVKLRKQQSSDFALTLQLKKLQPTTRQYADTYRAFGVELFYCAAVVGKNKPVTFFIK